LTDVAWIDRSRRALIVFTNRATAVLTCPVFAALSLRTARARATHAAAGAAVVERGPVIWVIRDITDLAGIGKVDPAVDDFLTVDPTRAFFAFADIVAALAGWTAVPGAALTFAVCAARRSIVRERPFASAPRRIADLATIEWISGAGIPWETTDVTSTGFAAAIAALAGIATHTATANLFGLDCSPTDEVIGRLRPCFRVFLRVAELAGIVWIDSVRRDIRLANSANRAALFTASFSAAFGR
jgi:hypothetical protein